MDNSTFYVKYLVASSCQLELTKGYQNSEQPLLNILEACKSKYCNLKKQSEANSTTLDVSLQISIKFCDSFPL